MNKNDYQGKRPDQVSKSYKAVGFAVGTAIFIAIAIGIIKFGMWIYHLIF